MFYFVSNLHIQYLYVYTLVIAFAVTVCTGLIGKESRVNISVDTRLQTEYLFTFTFTINEYTIQYNRRFNNA